MKIYFFNVTSNKLFYLYNFFEKFYFLIIFRKNIFTLSTKRETFFYKKIVSIRIKKFLKRYI